MREYNSIPGWKYTWGKRRAHWSILTLDDLPKTKIKYSVLVAQLKARYKTEKELGIDKLKQTSEDFSR
jgi:hypothetical protein